MFTNFTGFRPVSSITQFPVRKNEKASALHFSGTYVVEQDEEKTRYVVDEIQHAVSNGKVLGIAKIDGRQDVKDVLLNSELCLTVAGKEAPQLLEELSNPEASVEVKRNIGRGSLVVIA